MHHIFKSAIVPYSTKQMYQLINQIETYPQFLSWCSNVVILKQTNNQIMASIDIKKGMLNQSFTTINTLIPNQRIDIQLKEGPFNTLNGAWVLTKLNDKACKISLTLKFNFSSKLMDLTITPVFTKIVNTQLDAFISRAKQVY